MEFTYYGHSCFSVKAGGRTLLFDPFIRGNELAGHINVAELKPDVILLSHGHWDHMADAVEIARQSGAFVIANFEIVTWLQKQGVEKVHGMNTGGNYRFEWGNLKMVNAVHSSSLPDGAYGGTAGGFILQAVEGTFYYAGDTAISMDFKLIGEWYSLDFAVLPIGDNFTMGSEDAILCSDMIKCDKVIGVHYDTFPPIKIDKAQVVRQFENRNKNLLLLEIGESRNI